MACRMLTSSKQYDESSEKKQWFLARNCELSPLQASPLKKLIRPRGTWTITATALGGCETIELYTFTIDWPTSWARKGYSSLTIGSTTLSEYQEWHGRISQAIELLKTRAMKRSQAKAPSTAVEQRKPSETESVSHPRSDAPSKETDGPSSSTKRMDKEISFNHLATMPPKASRHVRHPSSDAAFQFMQNAPAAESAGVLLRSSKPLPKALVIGAAVEGDSSDDEDNQFYEASALGSPPPTSYDRWVPYKQTNGVAIYHLEDPDAKTNLSEVIGGEFMVAASVRGSPAEVLDVLLGGSSNTTILGPASLVETLESSADTSSDTRRETVRLILEAPGWAGRFCAPREMLVERLLKKDEG